MERNSTAGFALTSTGRRRDQRSFLTSRMGEMTGMVEASWWFMEGYRRFFM